MPKILLVRSGQGGSQREPATPANGTELCQMSPTQTKGHKPTPIPAPCSRAGTRGTPRHRGWTSVPTPAPCVTTGAKAHAWYCRCTGSKQNSPRGPLYTTSSQHSCSKNASAMPRCDFPAVKPAAGCCGSWGALLMEGTPSPWSCLCH